MKAGAMDFIEKPYNRQQLLQTVQKALHREALERERREQEAAFRACLDSLTARERQILVELTTTGRSNRVIGTMLGISCRTVEAHRAKLMRKMRAASLADLLQRAASFHLVLLPETDAAVQHRDSCFQQSRVRDVQCNSGNPANFRDFFVTPGIGGCPSTLRCAPDIEWRFLI